MIILVGKHADDGALLIAESSNRAGPAQAKSPGFTISKHSLMGEWIIKQLENDTFDEWGWRELDVGD